MDKILCVFGLHCRFAFAVYSCIVKSVYVGPLPPGLARQPRGALASKLGNNWHKCLAMVLSLVERNP